MQSPGTTVGTANVSLETVGYELVNVAKLMNGMSVLFVVIVNVYVVCRCQTHGVCRLQISDARGRTALKVATKLRQRRCANVLKRAGEKPPSLITTISYVQVPSISHA